MMAVEKEAKVSSGLSAGISCTVHEWPLSGNGTDFVKYCPCALLNLVAGAAWWGVEPEP